jgi:hypothetical protein
MPSLFAPKGTSQGYSALQNDVSLPSAPGSTGSSRFSPSPGRASVNITKPETIGQSIEGLGQGFLGLVGSVPLVGGLLKGTLETVGGAVGAVGTAIGSIKPIETGPSVGDVVSAIPGAAMDVISAPSKFVQRELISEFTAQQLLSNDKSGVQDYYDLPQIKSMVQAGATVDEIADVIYEQGRVFGAKPDIVRDVALGLITDPLTWIPGGAIASGAAKAGGLAKAVSAGAVLGAKESQFMKLWQPVGQVYNAISGTLSGSAKAFASVIAGRSYTMLEMAFKPRNIQNATKVLARVSPGEEQVVLATASELTSVTLGRTAKAGAAALIEDQASLSIAGSVDDMQDALLGLAKTAIEPLAPGDDKFDAVKAAVSDLLDVAMITKPRDRDTIVDLIVGQVSPLKSSDALEAQRKLDNILRGKFQQRAMNIGSAKEAEEALAIQGRLHGKSVTVAGARILIGGKQELIALADQPEAAREFVRNALGYAVGRSATQADQFFDELILPAINSGNLEDAIEYLEFVRMPAYGKLSKELAALRQTQTGLGSRVTLISQRTLSRARAADLVDSIRFAKSEEAAKDAIKLGITQYDELFATFGKISVDDLDARGFENLRDDVVKYLDENSNTFAVDIQADEFMELSEEIRAYWPKAEAVGYRLGIAPEDGVIKKWSTLQDKYGRYYQTQSFAPYADLIDTAFTNPQNLGSDLLTYKRNPLQSMVQYALSPRYGALITAKATNRFVTETANIGMNAQEARAAWQALNDLANEAQTLPRGLALEQKLGRNSSLAKKLNSVITKEARERIAARTGVAQEDAWNEVFMSMMRAYGGRVDDIGLMPAFTSWIKMKVPTVAIVTDRLYPFARFGELAPQFRYIQENIEPNFFRFTTGSGVREQRIAGLTRNDLRTRAIMGEFAAVREVGDAQTIFMVAGNHVAGRMAQKVPTFWESIGKFARGEASLRDVGLSAKQGVLSVEDRKRRAMQAIISRGAALRAYRVMAEEMPEVMPKLREFFGTDDPEEIMQLIGLDFIGRTDPVAAQKLIDNGIDVAMARQYTNRGYEPTRVALREKEFAANGGELVDDVVPDSDEFKELESVFDREVPYMTKADFDKAAKSQKSGLEVLQDIENNNITESRFTKYEPSKFSKTSFKSHFDRAVAKVMLKENINRDSAMSIVRKERQKLQSEMIEKALEKNGLTNATTARQAPVINKIQEYFGEPTLIKVDGNWVYGGSGYNYDAIYWTTQSEGLSIDELARKYSKSSDKTSAMGYSSYDEYVKAYDSSPDNTSLIFLEDALDNTRDDSLFLLAYDKSNNVSGFVKYVRYGDGSIEVRHMASFERERGIGSTMLARLFRKVKSSGDPDATLTVVDGVDTAEDFYKTVGMRKTGSSWTMSETSDFEAPPDFLYKRTGAPDEEVEAYRKIVSAFRKAASDEGERARRAIYFDPNRPWWERSLNHPLLALYPLSYMVGKVIPEFTRLLVATPFAKSLGGTRPFLGAEALRLTSDATVAAMQYDPDFRSWIEDNPEAWILLNWLLPYTPDNIGFGLSSTVRKLGVAKGMEGEGFDISRFPQEAFNQVVSAALPGTVRMGGAAVEDIVGGTELPNLEGAPDILDILQGKN